MHKNLLLHRKCNSIILECQFHKLQFWWKVRQSQKKVFNTKGTTTDFDGNYSIAVDQGDNLVLISYVGYKKQTIPVNSQRVINVTLLTDVSELDEVVVVGYGTQERRDITGAIPRVGLKPLKGHPTLP